MADPVQGREGKELGEIDTAVFLASHPSLLWTSIPDYGIIVHEGDKDWLVWEGPNFPYPLHVVDVTGLPIVNEVQKPPYESPKPPGSPLGDLEKLVIAGLVIAGVYFGVSLYLQAKK